MTKRLKINLITLFSILIVAIIGILLIPMSNTTIAYAQETIPVVTESGACGTSATWEFYEDTKELKISGSGQITSYSIGSAPWYQYKDNIQKITVADDITSMGEGIFSGMSALEELTIPFVGASKSVGTSPSNTTTHYPLGYMFGTTSYTGGNAVSQFSSTDYLNSSSKFIASLTMSSKTYYIPATLKTVNVTNSEYIFSGAFSYGYISNSSFAASSESPLKITTITLNEGIKAIGDCAFGSINYYSSPDYYSNLNYQKQYSVLENINLPSTLTSIGTYAFYNNQNLGNVEISGTVTTIKSYAFFNCKSLYTQIGSSVETIGSYAFYNCANLGNQTFPKTLTSIGDSAYYGCTSFTEINVPSNVTSVGGYAFSGCLNVTNITLEEGIETIGECAFRNNKMVTDLVVPTTVTSMGGGIFSGMSALEELTIPFVGASKSVGTYSSNTTHYPLGYMFGTKSYTGGNAVAQFSSRDYLSGSKFTADLGSYDTYYIPATLKTVNVTNSEYIFSGAFSYRYSSNSYSATPSESPLKITTITLNEGIKAIGECAFGSINYYSSPDYYSNLEYQNQYGVLENINLPSTLTSIGTYAFYNNQNLGNVEISGTVTTIKSYAFFNCKSLLTHYCYPNICENTLF